MRRLIVGFVLIAGCGSSPATGDGGAADLASPGGGSVASLSDTFDGTSLDPSWSVLHPEWVAVTEGGGALTLRLTGPAFWFNASEGVLVYKTVSGDFKLTATVHARKGSAPASLPDPPVHLGGVMARNPAAGGENYVFIVVGHDPNGIAVETKNTTSSSSQYSGVPQASGDAQLRVCRVGADFQMLKRAPGASTWTLAATFTRPDLPATLQVGPNIYSSSMTPDLQVTFDEAIFEDVSSAADCAS